MNDMNLLKCNNGHFYDADKYNSCPHCNSANDSVTVAMNPPGSYGDDMVTVAHKEPEENSVTVPGKRTSVTFFEDNPTISIYGSKAGAEPVVGWLVCIEGSNFGQSFPLKTGRNFVGRSLSMDVVLDQDFSVSRERHAIFIYEPKEKIFFAQPGDSRELFYLNEKVVLSNEVISAYDVVQIGSTKLMFVPFCTEKFSWGDLPHLK
jgi:hypothetical protein